MATRTRSVRTPSRHRVREVGPDRASSSPAASSVGSMEQAYRRLPASLACSWLLPAAGQSSPGAAVRGAAFRGGSTGRRVDMNLFDRGAGRRSTVVRPRRLQVAATHGDSRRHRLCNEVGQARHWEGVAVSELLVLAGPLPEASHVVIGAEHGFTANLPLDDFARPGDVFADLEIDRGWWFRICTSGSR